jgi:NNP family nitrate/nitrite transporter-like MFS transporter
MRGKGRYLAAMLALEGMGLIIFALAGNFLMAIISMISFALFLKMANGATYGMVPFIDKKNMGAVAGVVGAGGNLGGMLFGFLFASQISYSQAFIYMGIVICLISVVIISTKFQPAVDVGENEDLDEDSLSDNKPLIDIFDPETDPAKLMGNGIPKLI